MENILYTIKEFPEHRFESARECVEYIREYVENKNGDFKNEFDQYLDDEGEVNIGDLIFNPSNVLKNMRDNYFDYYEEEYGKYVQDITDDFILELETMTDNESRDVFGYTVYCDYINEGNEFTNDWEKMYDFFVLSKEKFLETYSYLTEDDYNATMEIVDNSGTSFAARKCTPISNIIDAIVSHSSK